MPGTSLTPADGSLQSFLIPDPPRPLEPYPPVEPDLDSLASILSKTNRLQILEYGVGWSTDVFAEHISLMTAKWANLEHEPHLTVVDADMRYISITANRILKAFGPELADELITFEHKSPELINIGNQIASCYPFMPQVPPDFIYIDAPERVQTKMPAGYPPITADVLRIEPYLNPGCIIVIDGRAHQARFIFRNLKNAWKYKYCAERDQHFFVQSEGTLGLPKHDRIMKEIYFANGEWTIDDL